MAAPPGLHARRRRNGLEQRPSTDGSDPQNGGGDWCGWGGTGEAIERRLWPLFRRGESPGRPTASAPTALGSTPAASAIVPPPHLPATYLEPNGARTLQ